MEHMERTHTEDGDYTCHECEFQTNNLVNFTNHSTKHRPNENLIVERSFRCNFCALTFGTKQELNQHKKQNHRTFKPCKNYATNNCEFDSDCLYNHVALKEGEFICFRCGDRFHVKRNLVNHIQTIHGHIQCRKFKDNNCTFGNKCLFKHNVNSEQSEDEPKPKKSQNNQIFCLDSQNPDPLDWPQLKKPEKMETHLQMLTQMNSEMITNLLPEMMKQIVL